MSRERCEEIMRRYLNEVLIQRKVGVIKEIAAEDMWDHAQPKPGRDGLERHAASFLERIQDLRVTVNHITANEDTVVGVWSWHGTLKTPLFGIPAGREAQGCCASIFKIRNGLLVDYTLVSAAKTTSAPMQQGGATNVI